MKTVKIQVTTQLSDSTVVDTLAIAIDDVLVDLLEEHANGQPLGQDEISDLSLKFSKELVSQFPNRVPDIYELFDMDAYERARNRTVIDNWNKNGEDACSKRSWDIYCEDCENGEFVLENDADDAFAEWEQYEYDKISNMSIDEYGNYLEDRYGIEVNFTDYYFIYIPNDNIE